MFYVFKLTRCINGGYNINKFKVILNTAFLQEVLMWKSWTPEANILIHIQLENKITMDWKLSYDHKMLPVLVYLQSWRILLYS